MKRIFFPVFAFLLVSACNNTNDASLSGSMELESGILETETILPDGIGKTDMKITFDHHGARKLTEMTTSMTMAGSPMNTKTTLLIKDGYMYSWMNMTKKGNKMKLNPSAVEAGQGLDFTNITEGMKSRYHFKDEAKETVAGKSAQVYSFGLDKMKGKVCLWKGVPLKSEVNVNGKIITTNFKNLQENIDIASSAFDLPSDIEFTEVAVPNRAATP